MHLFGDSVVKDYTRVFYDSHWEADLARFDVQYLLLSKHVDETGNVYLIHRARKSKKWTVLFEDSVSVLFAKNF